MKTAAGPIFSKLPQQHEHEPARPLFWIEEMSFDLDSRPGKRPNRFRSTKPRPVSLQKSLLLAKTLRIRSDLAWQV